MPLVRIDMIEGRTTDEIKGILDTIQDCVVEAFEVPETDRYQIVTEHKSGSMVLLDTGLGFERTEKVINIQFFSSPRTHEMKMKIYELLADRLESEHGHNPKDLLISIFTNEQEDWSFGFGEAQYVTGKLP